MSFLKKFPIILILLFYGSCGRTPVLDDQTVAVVGQHAIILKDYLKRYSNYLEATSIKDNMPSRQAVLTNMINEVLLYHYDDNKKIYANSEFIKEKEWARRQMILGYLKDQEIFAKITVTDEEVRQAFVRVNEQIAARHIYATTEEEANRLYESLQKGAEFNQLARQVFSDSTLKNNGGYLGYFSWGDMDEAFENACYQMKPGEISKPVKTKTGYSIIKVEDRQRQPLLTENEYLNKKPQIIRLLRISKKSEAEKRYIGQFFNETKLRFNDEALDLLLKKLNHATLTENEQSVSNAQFACLEFENQPLSIAHVEAMINRMPEYHRLKTYSIDNLKTVIQGLLIQEKLLGLAEKTGYEKNPVVIEAIANADNNLFLKYKRAEIIREAVVSDSIAREYFMQNKTDFELPAEISIQEIIIDNHQQALNLKKELLQGADFAALARQHSLRKWTAQNGGVIDFTPLDRFGNLKDDLWQAAEGELLGPIGFEGFYGIFKVLGKKDQQIPEYESIKEKVQQAVRDTKVTEITMEYLNQFRKKVKVELNKQLIKSFILGNKNS